MQEKSDRGTSVSSFPSIPAFVLEIDVFHVSPPANKRIEKPADDADEKCAPHRCPETVNIKPWYDGGSELEHNGVNDECK